MRKAKLASGIASSESAQYQSAFRGVVACELHALCTIYQGACVRMTRLRDFIDLLRDDYRRGGRQPMRRSSPATKSLFDREGELGALSIV